MSGCRHNAKNTLVKNYLYLAEKNGATVLPLTTVTRVTPARGRRLRRPREVHEGEAGDLEATRTLTAEQVVFAAASLGTQKLLHRMKDEGHLPRLSERLGFLSRTNSESILGAIAPKGDPTDYSYGVAITSSWHPDEHTHIEPVRYGKGFNTMAMMQTVLTDGDGDEPRWRTWLKEMWKEKRNIFELYDLKHWSERTVIALVMQSLDNSITTYGKRGRFTGIWRMTSRQGHGAPNPTWIPVANESVRRIAGILGGTAGGNIGEPFNMPLTAHFIGGCAIGTSDGERRGRPLPAGLQPPRPARRRRLGDLRQPRREPVADDHRPGRAGHVVLAQQGRRRPAPAPRLGVRADHPGRARLTGRPAHRPRRPPPPHRRHHLTRRCA